MNWGKSVETWTGASHPEPFAGAVVLVARGLVVDRSAAASISLHSVRMEFDRNSNDHRAVRPCRKSPTATKIR